MVNPKSPALGRLREAEEAAAKAGSRLSRLAMLVERYTYRSLTTNKELVAIRGALTPGFFLSDSQITLMLITLEKYSSPGVEMTRLNCEPDIVQFRLVCPFGDVSVTYKAHGTLWYGQLDTVDGKDRSPGGALIFVGAVEAAVNLLNQIEEIHQMVV